jgi:hypothetical protein
MRFVVPFFVLLAIALGAASAQAQSCSVFMEIQSYDAKAETAEVNYTRGSQSKFFPRPEGSPSDTTKIPKKCSKKVTKSTTVAVKPTGGRMTVTQLRMNYSGKMLNDIDDATWVPKQLEKLIADKTTVVGVLRPAKARGDAPDLTTIYLPASEEDLAEIKRIEDRAEDVE